ncbi:GTP-binding protein [Geobacter sulfurreducens]|uniref:GTP-binding protein n=1 Tax=Geobacter sulfurreducens TaxID=35554 RepID=UPI000DBB755E|nr:ADP-ribosylation factor-like protein [Geobacter sulfurreducens]BBA70427.1 Mutual gliding-motility protein MglA [Geobacter sulfurreducens]
MALLNSAKREINAKIVFFGAPCSGKSSLLRYIHGKLKQEFRGPLKTVGGRQDRLFFFDVMPPELGEVNGNRVRFHLYTVQGEVADPATWKMVLKGADGVIFVADASPDGFAGTRRSLEGLREIIRGYGQDVSALPFEMVCNKSDLPDAVSADDLRCELGVDAAALPCSAVTGEGILSALSRVVKSVIRNLRDRQSSDGGGVEGLREDVEETRDDAVVAHPPEHGAMAMPAFDGPHVSLGEPVGPAGDPELSLVGIPTVSGRVCRMTLAVRAGGRESRYSLTVALDPEPTDG